MIFRSLGNPFFSFTGVMKIDSFYREIDVGRTHLYLFFAALELYGVHIMTCSSNMVASPYWKVSLKKNIVVFSIKIRHPYSGVNFVHT